MSVNSLESLESGTSGAPSGSNDLCTLSSKPSTPFEKCPRCRVQYDFIKRVGISKVPLILDCKHTVCEDCIRKLCLGNKSFCPVCNKKIVVPTSKIDHLVDLFEPHFSLIGHLVWNKNSASGKKQFNWKSTGVTLGNNSSVVESSEVGFDDDDEFENESNTSTSEFTFDYCPEHPTQFVNIECANCSSTYCSYCFLEYHSGHTAIWLYKLSDAEKEDLNKMKHDVEVIFAQLLASQKKIKELKKFDTTDVEIDVQNYFYELHAKLQLAESNIKKKLAEMKTDETDLDTVSETLKSGIHRVMQILKHFDLINSTQLNLRALVEEVQNVRSVPCRLVSDQGGLQPIEFITDNVFDDIEEIVSLKSVPSMEYTLLPIEDWSYAEEKYEVEKIKHNSEIFSAHQQKASSQVKTSIGSDGTNTDTTIKKIAKTSIGSDGTNTDTTMKKPEPEKGLSEVKFRVLVTHINDLNSFYVQKYSTLDQLKEMNMEIERRMKKRVNLEELRIGRIYGVHFATKNRSHWRRGKLIDILDDPNDKKLCKVYFIDYGNTQCVTIDKLRSLEFRTCRRPNLAFECKLTNTNEASYDSTAHLQLPQIIGDKELYICYIKRVPRGDPQEVDLFVSTSSGGLISIRDLLSKTSETVFEPIPQSSILLEQLKLFKNSKVFNVGQEESVVIKYIRDPHYICVQFTENVNLIHKMKNEMNSYYVKQPTISFIPSEDTDVVVYYENEIEGNWHRAKILSVSLSKKQAEVFFVDWGNTAVVPWSSIKNLTEEFIKMESQAIIVKLADISKLESMETWTKEAINFLRENIASEECFRMVVSKVKPLEVALFQSRPAADICLNSLLVEEGHAVSTGTLSLTVYWPNAPNDKDEEDSDFSSQMVKKSEDILMENEVDTNPSQYGLKLQISVVRFESPDLIYIRFTKNKETEDELYKELQIHYSQSRKTKNQWKVGEFCVVYDSHNMLYYRAEVKSAPKSDSYTVYLYDNARSIKVHKTMMYVQDSYFSKYNFYVYKCRLTNIKPAGDVGKWSNLAIEILGKIFEKYKVLYIKKLEVDQENKMLGVLMWYCLTSQAKALEPSKVYFISINQALIESGVAFAIAPTAKLSTKEQVTISDNKPSKNDKQKTDKKDWYEMVCEEELVMTLQQSWPNLCKLQVKDFKGILTCIDSDGYFFVRDEMLQKSYLEVEKSITEKISSLEPSQGVEWAVNDLCSVWCDDKWYRGTILEVLNSNEYRVEMIDFGSEHVVTSEGLTKYLMFLDVPPLLYKVKLYDVQSGCGQWTPDDINTLLEIVTDNIRVVVKDDLHCNIPAAEIYLENGLSLNDLITRKCPHMYRRENHVVLESIESPEEDEGLESHCSDVDDKEEELGYIYIPFTPLEKKQKMYILSVLTSDNIFKVVLSKEKVNCGSKDFIALNTKMQELAYQQPLLQNFELNKPCACLHPEKKLWSRALIYRIDNIAFGYVWVFFVDYGTVEMILTNNLKEMRPEWFQLTVALRMATVNIELIQISQAECVLMKMNNLCGKSIMVDIVSESPLKVHLYDSKNLYYQNFINCGIVKAL